MRPMEYPFQHCSACGSPQLQARSPREWVCSACGYRHFITPIPPACALLTDSAGRLLIIRRAHEPGFGLWGLPGGVIEGGETGEQACAREVWEEVGLEVPVEHFQPLVSLPNRYLFQGFVWPTIDLFYTAQVSDFSALRPAAAEVSEWAALALDQIPLDHFAFASNAEAVRRLRMAQEI